MIRIKIEYGDTYKVQVLGHSPKSLGGKGENLLCAGVSVLAQSVFLYLWSQKEIQSYQKEDGFLEFETNDSLASKTGLEILRVGLKDLQTQYPNLLSIEIGGENGT